MFLQILAFSKFCIINQYLGLKLETGFKILNKIELNSIFLFKSIIQSVERVYINTIAKYDMDKLIILISFISIVFFLVHTYFLVKSRNKLQKANSKIKENANFIADQHEEILLQFELIKKKNTELNKYREHLEKLDKNRSHKLMWAKEKAKESDRFKSSLISNIYHEIRTPLNAIIGFVQLLSIEETIKNTNYIQIIEKNADDLLLLVDNMIELSKLQSEKTNVQISEFKIKEFAHKIYNETLAIKNVNKKDKIEIKLQLNGLNDEDLIFSDKGKIQKITKQLINNALKYTTSGSIIFDLKKINNEVRFSISDTGIGMEENKLEGIFNSFHKIEDHPNLYRGMGLGLSLAKQLAKQINVKIQVESELNKGTKFILTIPNLKMKSYSIEESKSMACN